MKRSRLLLSVALVLALGLAQAAGASVTTDLGTYTGPNIDFTLIEETTQNPLFGPSDDADAPLFGSASGSGNSLVFTPNSFIASASGAGGADEDHATLNIMMESINPLVDTIDIINITELGDYTLETIPPGGGLPGTDATLIFLQMTGNLLITEISNGIATMDVSGLGLSMAIEGFFDIGDNVGAGSTTLTLDDPGARGGGTWSGTDSLDVTAYLASMGYAGYGATATTLVLDNKLWAFSESGTVASVQKKIGSDGVIIEVIPEPTTGLLLVGGLIALGIRSRGTRV